MIWWGSTLDIAGSTQTVGVPSKVWITGVLSFISMVLINYMSSSILDYNLSILFIYRTCWSFCIVTWRFISSSYWLRLVFVGDKVTCGNFVSGAGNIYHCASCYDVSLTMVSPYLVLYTEMYIWIYTGDDGESSSVTSTWTVAR